MAFYGTLRQGFDLHRSFQNHLKFISQTDIPGYRLYDLGAYPYALYTGIERQTIKVELYEVLSEKAFLSIEAIETEAGYKRSSISIAGESFEIYLFDKIILGSTEISGGDWTQYYLNTKHNLKG